MRDRREVLKLLAGGTAAAAGATLITTSTAFAFGGTTTCRPNGETAALPTVNLGTTSAARVASGNDTSAALITINNGANLSIATATCPTCHPGVTPTALQQYKWSVDSVALSRGTSGTIGTYGFFAPPGSGSEITSFQSGPIPASIRLQRTDAPLFVALGNNSDLDFTVRLTVRWVCQNLFGGRTRSAWRCRSFTLVVRYSRANGSSSYTVTLNSAPAESSEGSQCDTGISA